MSTLVVGVKRLFSKSIGTTPTRRYCTKYFENYVIRGAVDEDYEHIVKQVHKYVNEQTKKLDTDSLYKGINELKTLCNTSAYRCMVVAVKSGKKDELFKKVCGSVGVILDNKVPDVEKFKLEPVEYGYMCDLYAISAKGVPRSRMKEDLVKSVIAAVVFKENKPLFTVLDSKKTAAVKFHESLGFKIVAVDNKTEEDEVAADNKAEYDEVAADNKATDGELLLGVYPVGKVPE